MTRQSGYGIQQQESHAGVLEGHSGSVGTVLFSPDGTLLVSKCYDNSVRLSDVSSKTPIDTSDFPELIESRVFSDDRKHPHDRPARIYFQNSKNPPHEDLSFLLAVDGEWVIRNTKKLLWLPWDYRPKTSAVKGNILAIRHESGRVTIMRFD